MLHLLVALTYSFCWCGHCVLHSLAVAFLVLLALYTICVQTCCKEQPITQMCKNVNFSVSFHGLKENNYGKYKYLIFFGTFYELWS